MLWLPRWTVFTCWLFLEPVSNLCFSVLSLDCSDTQSCINLCNVSITRSANHSTFSLYVSKLTNIWTRTHISLFLKKLCRVAIMSPPFILVLVLNLLLVLDLVLVSTN